MEIVSWLWWGFYSVVGAVLAVSWFLISGWVSTLMQIAVLVAVVYFLKYGWQRAPVEIWRRSRGFARFFLAWIRAREPDTAEHPHNLETVRVVRAKEFGDINISTLLSLAVFGGLILVSQLPELTR